MWPGCQPHASAALTPQNIPLVLIHVVSRDNVDGMESYNGLDGPGIECPWDQISRTRPYRPQGPPSLLYNGYRVFPGGKAAGAWR